MDANGVLASLNFPTMAGFSARTFNEGEDKDVALIMMRAYNDWVHDEWCAAYPDRFIPLGMVPIWDPELAAAEVRRIAKKGCRSISFLETPHVYNLPSFPVRPLGPDAAGDQRHQHGLVAAHRRRLRGDPAAARGPDRPPHGPRHPDRGHHRPGPALRWRVPEVPGPAGRPVRRRHRLVPFYLDRIDRHWTNQTWLHGGEEFGGKLPSEVFREHFLCCYITDPSGLELRHRMGMDIIAWECDYPHTDTTWPESPEFSWKELQDAGCTPEQIDKITFENACRFFDWDPFQHTRREDATVGALRARATDVDTTRMSRAEWKAQNEAAGIGVFA
jgi:hypothetical protein